MATPEQRFKKEIKRYIESRGGFWSVVTGGAYSKPGDPDIVACFKGLYIGIEAKTPTGVQSDWQKTRQEQIEESEGIYLLARDMDDVINLFDMIEKAARDVGEKKEWKSVQ